MRTKTIECVCIAAALLATSYSALAQDAGFDIEGIQAFLPRNFDGKNSGMVIGVVDEHGTQVFSAGKLDNGTDQEVDGDTLFEIGSVTKTFTVLLLEDMVNRGEMKLDDRSRSICRNRSKCLREVARKSRCETWLPKTQVCRSMGPT
jgi:CubicO group peptidase (beta-lactamase class C family)